jgi:hypothetical protein
VTRRLGQGVRLRQPAAGLQQCDRVLAADGHHVSADGRRGEGDPGLVALIAVAAPASPCGWVAGLCDELPPSREAADAWGAVSAGDAITGISRAVLSQRKS